MHAHPWTQKTPQVHMICSVTSHEHVPLQGQDDMTKYHTRKEDRWFTNINLVPKSSSQQQYRS